MYLKKKKMHKKLGRGSSSLSVEPGMLKTTRKLYAPLPFSLLTGETFWIFIWCVSLGWKFIQPMRRKTMFLKIGPWKGKSVVLEKSPLPCPMTPQQHHCWCSQGGMSPRVCLYGCICISACVEGTGWRVNIPLSSENRNVMIIRHMPEVFN